MKCTTRWLLGWLALLTAMHGAAQSVLDIEITGGTEAALPIAIVPFGWQGEGPSAPQSVAEIIVSDLQRSGQFEPLPIADLVARPEQGKDIRFQDWRLSGVDNVVVGQVRTMGPDEYAVQFQLFDVVRGKQLAGYSLPAGRSELRAVAHYISDLIFEKLTGVRGAFGTRIAYVVVEGSVEARRYRLLVAHSDGHSPQTVLESQRPIMSPAWSPDGRQLAYVSFEKGPGHIYIQTLESGRRLAVSTHKGINGAPAWGPQGRRLALTLSRDGNPEIYLFDITSKRLTRLTHNVGIDTEPAWMPDGESLLFTSDRAGSPQIYEVAVRGGMPQRITFEGAYNARPSISADGLNVAMVHGDGRRSRIAVLNRQTGGLRVLSDGRLDESPSFAPNGAMILYATRRQGRGALAGVSIDGRVRQSLRVDVGEVREPAWSPFVSR